MPDAGVRHTDAVASLSACELEFLRRLVAGESRAYIIAGMNLRDAEGKALASSMMAKLRAGCRADAVREGIYAGL